MNKLRLDNNSIFSVTDCEHLICLDLHPENLTKMFAGLRALVLGKVDSLVLTDPWDGGEAVWEMRDSRVLLRVSGWECDFLLSVEKIGQIESFLLDMTLLEMTVGKTLSGQYLEMQIQGTPNAFAGLTIGFHHLKPPSAL